MPALDDSLQQKMLLLESKQLRRHLHTTQRLEGGAVQRNGQAAFVYVVKSDQTVEMRTIKTDATDGNVTAVTDANDNTSETSLAPAAGPNPTPQRTRAGRVSASAYPMDHPTRLLLRKVSRASVQGG